MMRNILFFVLVACLLVCVFTGEATAASAGAGARGGGAGLVHRPGGPTTYGDDLTSQELAQIELMMMDSPPQPPAGEERPVVTVFQKSATMLPVPTSTWTFGCSATSAGMMFGYFDRNGWPNMYTGPTKQWRCPPDQPGPGHLHPHSGFMFPDRDQERFRRTHHAGPRR